MPAVSATECSEPMDPSLKQRLLGAAVLVALAIIFVPMLLTGPGPERPESVDLPIPPAPEPAFEQRSLAVQLPQPRPVDPGVTSDILPTVDTATAPAPVVRAVVPEARDAAAATGSPAATPPEPAATTPAPAASPSVTPAPAPAGTAANARFYIPAGVYTRAGNADELVARLKRAGYPALSEATQWQGQAAQRVRVGPFDSRAGAEAARLRLKDGERGLVVGNVQQQAGDATSDAPPQSVPSDRAGGWAVQLGAFSSREDANTLRARAVNAGFPAFVDETATGGKAMWRVRIGPHAERASAEGARAAARDKLKIDGLVVAQP